MMSVAYKRDVSAGLSMEAGILKVLAYFSLFRYPLTRAEIIRYLPPCSACSDIDDALELLVADAAIFRIAEFYLLQNDPGLVKRRREGNQRAAQLIPKATRIGQFLSRFPFVRGVGISGSLSKMFADEKTDIDFFIITSANRLWIARTLMHLFKKFTFLTGRQHLYCMNYYIDEQALTLQDQNIYTAIETITLIPVGGNAMPAFFSANTWVNYWFADQVKYINAETVSAERSWLIRFFESAINNAFGERLDNFLMKITTDRWRKKKLKGMRTVDGKAMDLVTGKHFARSNPGMFQERLLALYAEALKEISQRYPLYFTELSAG